jgi:hypothetical protein
LNNKKILRSCGKTFVLQQLLLFSVEKRAALLFEMKYKLHTFFAGYIEMQRQTVDTHKRGRGAADKFAMQPPLISRKLFTALCTKIVLAYR